MKYLVTGHTGFKGSWLTAMLTIQGHEVHGVALKPEKKSLFNEANIEKYLISNTYLDIRNGKELKQTFEDINPDVVIHLAAQPLVRSSYADPVGTYETNVIGTLNVLEATRELDNLCATQIITTDKVYKNKNNLKGYVETDELGGDDPYSSSKAAADIATQTWRANFGKKSIAISRAGNVIGGGDYSKDRIIPDLVNAISTNSSLVLRNPVAIRPWQHVLDCLNGYLMLADKQIRNGTEGEWNFSPLATQIKSVQDLCNDFALKWGSALRVDHEMSQLKESELLVLNSDKSRNKLGWFDKLDWDTTIDWTVSWFKASSKENQTTKQIENFLNGKI